jgi:4-hydroxybenzoate polyprenyltransferase
VKLATALRLGRVSNLPTVVTNVLAGCALGGLAGVSFVRVALVALGCSLLYVGGMFLNDAYDAEVDARERSERPIPSGEVTRREVFVVGFSLLGMGVAAAASAGVLSAVFALLTAAAIVLYDFVHKRTALAPALMGACRVGVYGTAASIVPEADVARVALGSALLFGYVVALTYAAARENSTMLVRFLPLVFLFAPALVVVVQAHTALVVVCALLLLGWTIRCVRLVRSRVPGRIRVGIGGLIAAISLLDALWLSALSAPLALVVLSVAAFAATLLLQRWVAGT